MSRLGQEALSQEFPVEFLCQNTRCRPVHSSSSSGWLPGAEVLISAVVLQHCPGRAVLQLTLLTHLYKPYAQHAPPCGYVECPRKHTVNICAFFKDTFFCVFVT